jgi:hypothetical protein
MSKQFELVALVAQGCAAFGKRDGLVGIGGCIDKLADIKLKGPANSALMAIAEAVGPQFVAGLVHKKAAGGWAWAQAWRLLRKGAGGLAAPRPCAQRLPSTVATRRGVAPCPAFAAAGGPAGHSAAACNACPARPG